MSKEFKWIWKRPLLVDHLLEIWEQKHQWEVEKAQIAHKSLHVLDALATMVANIGSKGDPIKSVLDQMFRPVQKVTGASFDREMGELIAKAEQARRESLGWN